MASASQVRVDPTVSLAAAPPADGTPLVPASPPPDGPDVAAVDVDAVEVGASSAAPTAPSGFPIVGLIAAVSAHALVAAALYALMLYEPPQEAKPPTDLFEIVLAEDMAGRADGTARQAPDGAPRPDVIQDPDARAPTQPADEPANDPLTAPHRPTQPLSFDARPMPPAAQPVPDTAAAWTPRVQPSVALPLPASEPKAADPATPPKPEAAKPTPAPKPVVSPSRPPTPAPTQPAPAPSVRAAAPPVPPRPSMQRSVDLREVAGLAPSRTAAAGSSSGSALEANYASLLFRAIDRVRFYPIGARDRGEEGRVVLRVTIAADGRLLDAYIARGSGFPELDAATIEMARRAAPYPPLPRALGAERASFNVPVIFGIRRL
jgi:protein TonB